jgi:hypothetical protein
MKKRADISWVLPLLTGALVGLTDPAVASLKRVIVLERPESGFLPIMKRLKEERLRLAHSGMAAESEESRASKHR